MKIDNQRKIHINYDSMEELLNRQEHIVNTMQNYLDRNDNIQHISNTDIIVGKDKYSLVITLDTN